MNITYKLYKWNQHRAKGIAFKGVVDIQSSLQDLTNLDWSESATSSATGGSYLKARRGEGVAATYYKLSCYDEVNGVYGHECVNELIASRLMDVLCIEHVPYRLVHARITIDGESFETWLSESDSFRKQGQSKIALARFYGLNRLPGEGRLEFCQRFGWSTAVQKAMLVDYLIANRDRHGANLEVLKERSGNVRLAPLFDSGLSLCFSSFNSSQLADVKPTGDVVANNFLGTRSLEQNLLRFVPPDLGIARLTEAHERTLFQGLETALDSAIQGVSGQEFAQFLWRMIWERWCRYEDFRDSGRLQAQS